MLFVLFSAGHDRYAISSRQIEEVIPFARLKSMPHSHPAFAGLLNFRGKPVPVLDFNVLLDLSPVEPCFVSRIMLCKVTLESGVSRLLGLLAEKVTETRNLAEIRFIDPGSLPANADYIGRVYEAADGSYIQWIHPDRVLPDAVLQELTNSTLDAT
ncbi:chemotaxis protein CheW [Luteolibacter pohnpeiensis]|uniref:Chemotaxis protein CheW n=1 Tax=Luteolibacter pohnpeiensis TaxID=454153 RepID=A0A934VX27_9BACT|nr:chemotaxis protein CheW [Luteolibacter pohnpeiensis]MBK1883910.1 chemotaxis protein CheW [Luteolibacter pohnpeiensis]